MAVEYHRHIGTDAPRIRVKDLEAPVGEVNSFLQSSNLLFEVVDSVPSGTPTNFLEQIKLYVNGADVLLYVYDYVNDSWESFNYYTP